MDTIIIATSYLIVHLPDFGVFSELRDVPLVCGKTAKIVIKKTNNVVLIRPSTMYVFNTWFLKFPG